MNVVYSEGFVDDMGLWSRSASLSFLPFCVSCQAADLHTDPLTATGSLPDARVHLIIRAVSWRQTYPHFTRGPEFRIWWRCVTCVRA